MILLFKIENNKITDYKIYNSKEEALEVLKEEFKFINEDSNYELFFPDKLDIEAVEEEEMFKHIDKYGRNITLQLIEI